MLGIDEEKLLEEMRREVDSHYVNYQASWQDIRPILLNAYLILSNRRARDASETAALRKVRDEMERGEYSVSRGYDGLTPLQVRRSWFAALDAILEGRKG